MRETLHCYIQAFPLLLATAMTVLVGTVTNVALPTLAETFETTPSDTIWVVNSYQLIIIMVLLPFSAFAEIKGYKRVFMAGVILFSAASVLCAAASSLSMLIAFRLLQGLGAGAVMSVNAAIIRQIYPPEMLGRGIGLNAMVVAISAASGPSLAGAVLAASSWHWLFLINLPLGLLSAVLSAGLLDSHKPDYAQAKFNAGDCALNALTFGLLIYTLDGIAGRVSPLLLAGQTALLAVSGIFYTKRQLRSEHPVLPVDLLKIPFFTMSVLTSVCSFTGQMLAMVSLPFFYQNTLHFTAPEVGMLLTPWPLSILFIAPIAGRLAEKFHPAPLSGIGLLIFAAGLLSLCFLPEKPDSGDILPRMALTGAGFGLFQTPNNVAIISSAPKNRSGGAAGMQSTARLLGQSAGTALVAVIFRFTGGPSGTRICLLLAGGLALAAAAFGFGRLSAAGKIPDGTAV